MNPVIAIIPARGGSKRIPRKNIKEFCGKPLILWTIQKLEESSCFDKIIVSTDDEEIANIVQKNSNAQVPFLRPQNISDDFATTAQVLEHALKWLHDDGQFYQTACCVYPASVFVKPEFLHQGLLDINTKDCQVTMSVCNYPHPTQRALILKNSLLSYMYPEFSSTRTNDLTESYYDAAMFYFFKTDSFMQSPVFSDKKISPVFIPKKFAIDIDDMEDFELAESMFKTLGLNLPDNTGINNND